MRQGQQHRRGRGRNNGHGGGHHQHHGGHHRKGQNPLTRSFESNGPEVKVRGTPAHIAEKYLALARDAQLSGDPVLAENYLQHAEHYNRIILAYREQQGVPGGEPGGVPQQRVRSDMPDAEPQAEDDVADEASHADQPTITRFPEGQRQGELMRSEGRHEGSRDERSHRGEAGQPGVQTPRFRERHDRPERHRFERSERYERPDRGEMRGERMQRGERNGSERGYDRPAFDRPMPHDRPTLERSGEDRVSESRIVPDEAASEFRHRGPHEGREGREARDAGDLRDARAPRDARERDAREGRVPRQRPAEELAPGAEATANRPEGSAVRRRERFVPEGDQPEFLRRPVRRPRRESDAAPADQQALPDDPPRD